MASVIYTRITDQQSRIYISSIIKVPKRILSDQWRNNWMKPPCHTVDREHCGMSARINYSFLIHSIWCMQSCKLNIKK